MPFLSSKIGENRRKKPDRNFDPRRIGGFTAEESGYDSDATRKSSPRSSLKNDATLAAAGGKAIVGSSDDCDSRCLAYKKLQILVYRYL
jgi:hypothetical protein